MFPSHDRITYTILVAILQYLLKPGFVFLDGVPERLDEVLGADAEHVYKVRSVEVIAKSFQELFIHFTLLSFSQRDSQQH